MMTSLLIDNPPIPAPVPATGSLEAALRSVEPAAVLLAPWVLQNVIAADRGRGRSPFNVPHRASHVIARKRLLELAESQRLTLPDELPMAEMLILLARPETDWLAQRREADVLGHYWQLLFHAKIDLALGGKFETSAQPVDEKSSPASSDIAMIAGGPSPGSSAANDAPQSECRTDSQTIANHQPVPKSAPSVGNPTLRHRIERIGRSTFSEACFVLHQEKYVPMKADEAEIYSEFAAVFLELHYFRPDLLPVYFPAIASVSNVLDVLRQDVDSDIIFQQTRLPGAAEPRAVTLPDETALVPSSPRPSTAAQDARRLPSLSARADRAAAVGNHVRAAILRRRVFLASAGSSPDLRDVGVLADRLAVALQLDAQDKEKWREMLTALTNDAAEGWWNPDGRLLYDLQKICLHAEHEIYSVGVVDWLLEGCRRPLRRAQPNQRLALICKSLRSAARRIARTKLPMAHQAELTHLIQHAEHHTETRLRDALRPAITNAIEAGGLLAKNAPEQVAEHKLTEELLDSLTQRGFLTLGAVRDAISSNQIKFEDISRTGTIFTRDPLFRIDRRLSDSLDGVYHRGEIYRRLFQKVSSWAFATDRGRTITRTVLIPLGGAFIIVEGLDHTVFLLFGVLTRSDWFRISWFEEYHHSDLGLILNLPFVVIALMLLGAVNSAEFRATTLRMFAAIGRAVGHLFVGVPRWIMSRPGVQAVMNSREMRFATRYVFKPLIIAAVVVFFLPHHISARTHWIVLGSIFAGMNLLLNSRHGRAIEQVIVHWLRMIGSRFTMEVLGNVFSGIMHFFAKLLEDFDRMLYAVDEWLRFREGQPRSSLWVKAALGVFWFYVAYVARFVVNLLAEPQVNPIKHFPVVTVSHKIVLPTFRLWQSAFESLGIGAGRASTFAFATVTSIPGIFGFLAWELRANWKLYRANRPRTLRPISIGSHGETMARLLRPGFHSGTVPKLFARQRKVRRNAHPGAAPAAHDEAAEHVEHAVAHFIERELLYRLNEHPQWRQTPIALGEVCLSPTRITIALSCPACHSSPAVIFFEQRAGWIVAGIGRPGWIEALSPAQSRLLSAALLGLYKTSGVELVKEQIERVFDSRPAIFELSRETLTVWPDGNFAEPVVVPLVEEPGDAERPADASYPSARSVLLKFVTLTWDQWVGIWDGQAACDVDENYATLPPTADSRITGVSPVFS
ncbi:MAG TPA: hypothetical protein VFE47_28570 [Tepidisphaeraceae bacterium]|jgi:hypothetical protein|nr:hypothetical protein [Tepidisphaeraceae bacterium]